MHAREAITAFAPLRSASGLGARSVLMSMSVCLSRTVCLSASISPELHSLQRILCILIYMAVAEARYSAWCCDMLRTSAVMDDAIFAYRRHEIKAYAEADPPRGSTELPGKSLMSTIVMCLSRDRSHRMPERS